MRVRLLNGIWIKLCFIIFSMILNTADSATIGKRPIEPTSLSKEDCNRLIAENVFTDANPVQCHRLSKVKFSYFNEDGVVQDDGKLIVLDVLASNVTALMHDLLRQKFLIAKARPIENYRGDDQASMKDNNSSAFNGRAITGGSRWSMHAYGAAIDINPVQNPFIDISEDGTALISPIKSAYYAVNRLNYRPGKAIRPGMAEEVVDSFARHGFFIWGGYWNYPVDYQHFQVGPRSFIKVLAVMDREEGEKLLDKFISIYVNCRKTNDADYALNKVRAKCIDIVLDSMP